MGPFLVSLFNIDTSMVLTTVQNTEAHHPFLLLYTFHSYRNQRILIPTLMHVCYSTPSPLLSRISDSLRQFSSRHPAKTITTTVLLFKSMDKHQRCIVYASIIFIRKYVQLKIAKSSAYIPSQKSLGESEEPEKKNKITTNSIFRVWGSGDTV